MERGHSYGEPEGIATKVGIVDKHKSCADTAQQCSHTCTNMECQESSLAHKSDNVDTPFVQQDLVQGNAVCPKLCTNWSRADLLDFEHFSTVLPSSCFERLPAGRKVGVAELEKLGNHCRCQLWHTANMCPEVEEMHDDSRWGQ